MNSIHTSSFEFLSKESLDSSLKCNLCSQPLETPWAHIMCDKVFCKECIEKAKFICPSCPISKKFEFFEVRASSLLNLLGNLFIICKNCNTSMKRVDFENHLKVCNNTKKLEENNDNKIFGFKEEELKTNGDLPEKTLKRTFQEFNNNTKTDLVDCPLECGKKILLCEESNHYLDCAEIKVKCEANSQGCTAFLKRKEMNEHIKECDFVKLIKFLEEIEPKTAQFLDDILKMEEKNNKKQQHYPYISAFVNKVKNNFKHSKKMIIKKMKNYYDSVNNNIKSE